MAHVPPVRSNSGCWTCRLRKKKCDEVRPECERCAAIPLSCHYGPRPVWMKDDLSMKEELRKIKDTVKISALRKRQSAATARSNSSPLGAGLSLAYPVILPAKAQASFADSTLLTPEKYVPVDFHHGSNVNHMSVSVSPEKEHPVITSQLLHGYPANEALLPSFDVTTPSGSIQTPVLRTVERDSDTSSSSNGLRDHRETDLLMHYLDHVFHLQFRFYSPLVEEGGRGWLLSLLLRTKPLYHAALSLSAFHQQSLLPLSRHQVDERDLEELDNHRNLALKELQVFIQNNGGNNAGVGGLRENIQILACIVEMISFELFNGGVSNWKVHLKAASTLIINIYNLGSFEGFHDEDPDRTGSSFYHPGPQSVCELQSSDRAALRFFTGVIIWFDFLACISTGEPPYLSLHYNMLLAGDIQRAEIQLHKIMGCQNWAMISIGEIGYLASLTKSEGISHDRLQEQAILISRRIQHEQARIQQQLESPGQDTPETHISTIVTHIFACATSIYLSTTMPTLHDSPSNALELLKSAILLLPDRRMVRSLLWPLCVAGCTAKSRSDRDFFRVLVRSAVDDSQNFGNSAEALHILERCWERGLDVGASMNSLQNFVLLV